MMNIHHGEVILDVSNPTEETVTVFVSLIGRFQRLSNVKTYFDSHLSFTYILITFIKNFIFITTYRLDRFTGVELNVHRREISLMLKTHHAYIKG